MLKDFKEYFERYKLELNVFDVTTDTGIPAAMAITVDRTGHGPCISVGLSANLDQKRAILAAIEETQHSRPWMRDMYLRGKRYNKSGKKLTKIQDRGLFWYSLHNLKNLDFWLKFEEEKFKLVDKSSKSSIKNLKTVLKDLKDYDIFVKDVTIPEAKKQGFVVTSTMIPEMQPLYFIEKYKYLGTKRIYEVPPKLGYEEKTEEELNKFPHPFL